MAFLKFDKAALVNLEYSLSREILRSNRAGSFSSTTISGCNTRKYHGLLISPLEKMGGEHHILLSSLDATVVEHDKAFNLGIHKYEGDNYVPRGHKYIRDFNAEKGSKMTYRVGDIVLTRESMLVQKKEQILIKFTLQETQSVIKLRLQPFLAFRNIHKLSKANLYINRQYHDVSNGIKLRLYDGYPELYMQINKRAEFVPVPDWYYNIEYLEEQQRGYEFKEDLYVPGYFEVSMKQGESIIFSASIEEAIPNGLKRKFQNENDLRIPLNSFHNCLQNSAEQFIVRKDKKTEIIAGFPWYNIRARDIFIALPGLTLTTGDIKTFIEVINTAVKTLKDGLFPNMERHGHLCYNSSDAPLWFIWALQQLEKYSDIQVWKSYKKPIIQIMEAYLKGTSFGIGMSSNGLIEGGEDGIPVTWMEAIASEQPVTLRDGYAVEVNALWYNAVCQVLKWSKGSSFAKKIEDLPLKIQASFVQEFWNEEIGHLADYYNSKEKDYAVRPNQVIATSLEYSPLNIEMKKRILDVVRSELLTDKGLRTLSPKNNLYRGSYHGDQEKRERAAHQGTVYPWLLEHFVYGYLSVHKRSGLNLVKNIYNGFESDMTEYGIATISEMYDGNLPHNPKGAISFAASVASVLRVGEMIEGIS